MFLDLFICAHCDEYLIRKKWVKYSVEENAVRDFITKQLVVRKDGKLVSLELDIDKKDEKNYEVHILAKIRCETLELEEESDTIVRIKRNVCPKCNKIQGNYFESIVQVRPSGRKFSDEEKEALLNRVLKHVENVAKTSNEAFIAKITEEHGGFDAYISTIALGKSISRDLVSTYGAEYKESSSLQGVKDGHDIYRLTYLVRMPPYKLRDILVIDSRPYLVTSMGPASAKLRDLKSNEVLVAQNSDLRQVRVAGTKDDVVDAVVVMETDRELQLLDPTTMKTVEMKKPRTFTRTGETVKVFRYEGDLYLIGN